MEICKEFKFEASHVLAKHFGQCGRLHGHSWKLTVYVKGPVDQETGMVIDYADIKKYVQPIIDQLDHRHLGVYKLDFEDEALPFQVPYPWRVNWLPQKDWEPTSENFLIEIAKQIVKRGQVFSSLTLDETCTVSCLLTWEEFNQLGKQ